MNNDGEQSMTQGTGRVTITVRTSKDLQRWLKAQAKKNNRSLNQEVEFRLMQGREAGEAKPLLDELRGVLEGARKK
jgi:hypothetical protein